LPRFYAHSGDDVPNFATHAEMRKRWLPGRRAGCAYTEQFAAMNRCRLRI